MQLRLFWGHATDFSGLIKMPSALYVIGVGSLGLSFGGLAALAQSAPPIEAAPQAVPALPRSSLLDPYFAACPVGLAVEEFALQASETRADLAAGGWIIDPAQMTCAGAKICDLMPCARVVAYPKGKGWTRAALPPQP